MKLVVLNKEAQVTNAIFATGTFAVTTLSLFVGGTKPGVHKSIACQAGDIKGAIKGGAAAGALHFAVTTVIYATVDAVVWWIESNHNKETAKAKQNEDAIPTEGKIVKEEDIA